MGQIVPFAPVRLVRVFPNFGAWTVLLIRKGKRNQRLGTYSDKRVAVSTAARVCRIEGIPSPVVIELDPITREWSLTEGPGVA
ncbi:hypothetical protein [Methylobacterium goesingense]|uniref:Uncharacterized protein n=1 Tax=Methylobacterium goesingense TaxID=243690 RepID=A0ABV2LC19_9HYPH|nr:hypothetical protein [Methylobacterium goesingense]GJD73886.1 hypothetical protein CFIICLFH_2116 [Methylobacterium goesingense]